jgi:hypothetical protein
MVYLLLLLINDAVLYIQEDFLSQELFVCIGLAYLTQEFSRWSLLMFERLKWPQSFILKVVFQLIGSVILTIVLVTTAIYLYFENILFYKPSSRELYVFNSIFSFITVLYVVLYLGHFFLFRRNTKKIEREAQAKKRIEHDLSQYVNGIHPELLFESLEAMLVTMKEDPNKAEQLSDYFSDVYRYILSKRKREMVPLEEELTVAENIIELFNHLPHRKIKLGKVVQTDAKILPTAILRLIECIVRTTITTGKRPLSIDIKDEGDKLTFTYLTEEKLQTSLTVETLSDISKGYRFYSEIPVQVLIEGNLKVIQLPKLTYHESSDT